ncbi:MAG: phosphoglycerate kinase, partial [Bacteroidota bacterium]
MPSQLPSVKQCNELAGKRVLLRATLNVPVEDGIVTNQFRITRALPTINFLKQAGARVIMIGHIGRDPEHTLKPVHDILGPLVGAKWCSDFTGSAVESAIAQLADGEVLLLENTRSDERETAGDMSLAEELSTYADLYVNDAFAVSHREHVSVT